MLLRHVLFFTFKLLINLSRRVFAYLSFLQVANFASGEDDATFWSRWIQPDAVAQAEVCNYYELNIFLIRFVQ